MKLQQINKTCPICFCDLKNPHTIGCVHLFCRDCITSWIHSTTEPNCPVCRKNYRGLFKIPIELITSKYKTRRVTEQWRAFIVYTETHNMLDVFHTLNNMEDKCDQINKLMNYLYQNKWIFDRKRNIGTWFNMSGLRDVFKNRLEEFSKSQCFPEGKMWKYKFREVLK